MTVGESIKFHRTKVGLTQKDLSEKLNVSFQTISKWENDTNEPDLMTLKALCSIFSCTLDDLVSYEEHVQNINEKQEIEEPKISKVQIGTCRDCGKPLFSGDNIHHMIRSTDGIKESVDVCEDCYKVHQDLNKQKEALLHPTTKISENGTSRIRNRSNNKTLLIWSTVGGVAVFITLLIVCIIFVKQVSVAGTILLPLLGGYLIFADIFCLFKCDWINDLFIDIASFSIRMPGIIFSFDSDGIKFLIAMKILFWILGIIIMAGAIVFAILITGICSFFAFPFVVGKY